MADRDGIAKKLLEQEEARMWEPDERSWTQRLPRIQEMIDPPPGRDVIPPGLVIQGQGLDPTRKHGDAIDYDANSMGSYLAQKPKWKKSI